MQEVEASSTQAAVWKQYHQTHHGHMGPPLRSPLRRVEFDANFGPHLRPPPARVLEIGFGSGESLRYLAQAGYQDLHGWDISADCVEVARQNQVPATLHHVDALDALRAHEPDSFDVIIAKDLLEHLPRESVIPFTAGVFRVLKPGGVFLGRLPNMANPLAVFLRYDDFTHTLGFTENSLLQVFALGGFPRGNVRVQRDTLPAWPLVRHGLFGQLLREVLLGPLVRWLLQLAVQTQRKGAARVSTLRLIVAAEKPA
jgi:SAM-dependent methyltransferase